MDMASTGSQIPIIPAPHMDRDLTRADIDAMAEKTKEARKRQRRG